MKGKDITLQVCFDSTVISLFRIPFTRIVIAIVRTKPNVKVKPLEHRKEADPFDNADPRLADIARHQAMRMLGVSMTNVVFAGVGAKHVWIHWQGITWNAATWAKILKDIEFYATRKRTRTAVADDEYNRRVQRAVRVPKPKPGLKDAAKKVEDMINEPGGQN